ncbi:hypothetical protein K0U07_01490 [bacterium]|nr:hypothetical protein [bacterium]
MKKPNKLLTNQHLLKHYKNNFSLAEEAIALAYSRLDNGMEFDLQKVLNDAAKEHEQEEVSQ